MTDKSIPQYAEVEQPFGIEPPLVHCPICGEAPLKENEIVSCKHLSFIFVGEVCEFEYKSDKFNEKISQINDDEISLFTRLSKRIGIPNATLSRFDLSSSLGSVENAVFAKSRGESIRWDS